MDIGNLRREYSVPKNKLAEEHLPKRTLYKNTSQKTPSHKKRNANREIETRTRLGSQGDVWFGCSRFQDSGERIGGGRRYSEERGEREWRRRDKEITNASDKFYIEMVETVKEKSPHHLPYGKERLAAWLMESKLY